MKRIALTLAALLLVGTLRAQDEKPAPDAPLPDRPAPDQPAVDPAPAEPVKPAPTPETRVFAPPSVDDIRSKVVEWLATQPKATAEHRRQALALWTDVPAGEPAAALLDRLVRTFAVADPATKALVDECRLVDAPLLAPEADVIEETTSDFQAHNLRAFYGQYLVRRRMFDEALWTLEEADPALVVDPATCLFNRAVCEQHLLMREEATKTLTTLLENTESVPPRYTTVATLVKYNLEGLRPDTLDEVAHLMTDVENRLDLGRAGQRVQKKEDRIVAVLDKIIEKIEAGGGGGGGGGGAGPGDKQSSAPANESRIMGGKGPGEADEKGGEERDVWGGLPPKVAAQAKNLVDRNFPPHYKRAIEKYNTDVGKIVRRGEQR